MIDLTQVSLAFGDANDAGLEHLRTLTKLEKFGLRETRVTDAGLVHLSGLVQLRELDLSGTAVTDNGLVHLKALNRLELLLFETPTSTGPDWNTSVD